MKTKETAIGFAVSALLLMFSTKLSAAITYQYSASGVGPHAMTSVNGSAVVYKYDRNGNGVQKIEGGSTTRFEYTSTLHLKQEISPSQQRTRHFYDADGQKIATASIDGKVFTYFGGIRLAQQMGSSAAPNPMIRYGEAEVSEEGRLQFFVTDQLGSVVALVDRDGIQEVKDSLPYGQAWYLQPNPNDDLTDYDFNGNRKVGTLLSYNDTRYMEPGMGRFLQADTMIDGSGEAMGYNRYAYVHNNPVNAIDPTGHGEVETIPSNTFASHPSVLRAQSGQSYNFLLFRTSASADWNGAFTNYSVGKEPYWADLGFTFGPGGNSTVSQYVVHNRDDIMRISKEWREAGRTTDGIGFAGHGAPGNIQFYEGLDTERGGMVWDGLGMTDLAEFGFLSGLNAVMKPGGLLFAYSCSVGEGLLPVMFANLPNAGSMIGATVPMDYEGFRLNGWSDERVSEHFEYPGSWGGGGEFNWSLYLNGKSVYRYNVEVYSDNGRLVKVGSTSFGIVDENFSNVNYETASRLRAEHSPIRSYRALDVNTWRPGPNPEIRTMVRP